MNKKCVYPDCKIQPCYNIASEKKGLYCKKHKLEGMVNVKNKPCIYPECKTQSYYNIVGETKGLYCAVHKLEGMINVKAKNISKYFCEHNKEKYKG